MPFRASAFFPFPAALFFPWLPLLLSLSPDWTLNPQYHYGWIVPLLTSLLLFRLHASAPALRPPSPSFFLRLAWAALWLQVPLLWLLEANPDWRLLYWLLALLCIFLTFILMCQHGGKTFALHFLPPLLFFLVAVPWPFRIETFITQSAMLLVTSATVETLLWLGIPATQNGNWIDFAHGSLGVSDACSGIRSLQTLLMASLFLGQFYLLRPARRLLLIGWGIVLALVLNFIRTFLLVYLAIRAGSSQAIGSWHDLAGNVSIVASFTLLWWIASRQTDSPPPSPSAASRASGLPSSLSWSLPLAVLIFCLAVQLWYFAHERGLGRARIWTVRWPQDATDFRPLEAPETARTLLRYNRIQGAEWISEQGLRWSFFLIDYDSGSNSTFMANVHRPEVCMSSAGLIPVAAFPDLQLRVNDDLLRFRHLLFLQRGVPMHVFYTVWENQADPKAQAERWDWTWQGRIQAALDGHRNRGQQVLQACIVAPLSPGQARETCERWLKNHLQLSP